MTEPAMPRPPAQIAPYVEVLGVDGTVEFLLTFGGAELWLTANPKATSQLVRALGYEKAAELGRVCGHLPKRVPLAKQWTVEVLAARGLSKLEIARKVRVTDKTVRLWLKSQAGERRAAGSEGRADRQLKLPLPPHDHG